MPSRSITIDMTLFIPYLKLIIRLFEINPVSHPISWETFTRLNDTPGLTLILCNNITEQWLNKTYTLHDRNY
jgi:hypothetical protein